MTKDTMHNKYTIQYEWIIFILLCFLVIIKIYMLI